MMNLTMPPPISYPFYMDSSQHSYPNVTWPSNPYIYPTSVQQTFQSPYQAGPPVSYAVPFILQQQPRAHLPGKVLHSIPSYSNTRYNHLKQSTSHINRHRSMDASIYGQPMSSTPTLSPHNHHGQPYRTAKTKSVSDFHQLSNLHSTQLSKAHSWHSMVPLNRFHSNIHHSNEMTPIYEGSPGYNVYHPKHILQRRQVAPPLPNPNLTQTSSFDQMPIITNPIYQSNQSNSNRNSVLSCRNENHPNRHSSLSRSESSSDSSASANRSLLQKHFNGSLRTDPFLVAAMEDFQQLRRTSSRTSLLTAHCRDLSRDSLCSESSEKPSSSSSQSSRPRSRSPSPPRAQSQSSFTSLERVEIRHFIKALKNRGIESLNAHFPSSSLIATAPAFERSALKSAGFPPILKPQKSTITEELEKKFAQLRSIHPNEDLNYVKPSLLNNKKKSISPLKTVADWPKTEQETSIETPLKNENENKTYGDQISSLIEKNREKLSEIKPEYAIPMRSSTFVNVRSNKKKHDDQMRSFSFCKPMNDLVDESRPVSMLNWIQYGLTNPLPTGFPSSNDEDVRKKSMVKENIYASDIDVHVPYSDDKDYLHQTDFMADYLSSYKSSPKNGSIFHDFSRLFSRLGHHEHEEKLKRKCKLQQKNNYLRCSIM